MIQESAQMDSTDFPQFTQTRLTLFCQPGQEPGNVGAMLKNILFSMNTKEEEK